MRRLFAACLGIALIVATGCSMPSSRYQGDPDRRLTGYATPLTGYISPQRPADRTYGRTADTRENRATY
jgi:hypothetical protein